MECRYKIESGLQFLNRIKVRPTLLDIEKTLFPNGLSCNKTVELCGNSSSGKTILLTQLIAKCILPTHYDNKLIGGLGIKVIFLNTDYHFMILRLRDLLVDILNKNENIGSNQLITENIVKQSIKKLMIVNCYDGMQYSLTLHTLNEILLANDEIGLVAIDSIASYYWQDRQNGDEWMVNRYIENILKNIQQHTFISKIPLIYTRCIHNDSVIKGKNSITCVTDSILGKINCRIKLIRSDDNKQFTCTVETPESSMDITFIINHSGIVWNNEKKRKRDA